MDPRFNQLPRSLQAKSKLMMLGSSVPALIAHPELDAQDPSPIPAVIWLHGRTVSKELDSGRYSRWIRSGIGAVALDLPGHGERFDESSQSPENTLHTIEQASAEIDSVLESMNELGVFDMSNLAIGGMSAGGMVTLNRLCKPHSFVGAVLEGTTGNLRGLYFPNEIEQGRAWPAKHSAEAVEKVDPIAHLASFRPIPIFAAHNKLDRVVPLTTQEVFIEHLRTSYINLGADPELIQLKVFGESGAPEEHAGFGRFANESKLMQLEALKMMFGMSDS